MTDNTDNTSIDVDNAGVEVIATLSGGEAVLPARAGMTLTKARRRWMLLKNVVRIQGSLKTSLTPREEQFLQALHHETTTTTTSSSEESTNKAAADSDHDGDIVIAKARDDLRSCMNRHSAKLTQSESNFLTQLLESPSVSAEDLVKPTELLNSGLYTVLDEQMEVQVQQAKVHAKEAAATKAAAAAAAAAATKDTVPQFDPFRAELWTHTKKEEEVVVAEEEKIAESGEESKTPKHTSFIFKLFFPNKKEDEKEVDDGEAEMQEEPVVFSILGTSIEETSHQPHVLNPVLMDALRPYLPMVVQQDNFWLKYSMQRGDGSNLLSMWSLIRHSARTLLAIETMEGDVFGCFVSSPWRNQPNGYYGSGEAFLWRLVGNRLDPTTAFSSLEERMELESNIQVYRWTGENYNVQRLLLPSSSVQFSDAQLIVGGGGPDSDPSIGGGSALTIAAALSNGFSDPCPHTFGSASPLCSKDHHPDGMYDIANMEVWTLTPVDNVNQAEKLEFGRQFIFEQGHFVQA